MIHHIQPPFVHFNAGHLVVEGDHGRSLSAQEHAVLDLAAQAYSFVLEGRPATGAQWIQAIARSFDEAEPRNAEVIEVIQKALQVGRFKDWGLVYVGDKPVRVAPKHQPLAEGETFDLFTDERVQPLDYLSARVNMLEAWLSQVDPEAVVANMANPRGPAQSSMPAFGLPSPEGMGFEIRWPQRDSQSPMDRLVHTLTALETTSAETLSVEDFERALSFLNQQAGYSVVVRTRSVSERDFSVPNVVVFDTGEQSLDESVGAVLADAAANRWDFREDGPTVRIGRVQPLVGKRPAGPITEVEFGPGLVGVAVPESVLEQLIERQAHKPSPAPAGRTHGR